MSAHTTDTMPAFGTAVRLSFGDASPSNQGFVTRLDHTRESDGMRFWRVVFDPNSDESVTVPECLLVPVCSWEHSFIDFDGARASMPCGFDATRVLRYVDPMDPDSGETGLGFCTDHAVCVALDLEREGISYTVDEVRR